MSHSVACFKYAFLFPGYLKLWQLQNPKPRLSDQYDALFIDEAQDCTPGMLGSPAWFRESTWLWLFSLILLLLFLFFPLFFHSQPSWMCCCLSPVGRSWLEILISRSTPSKELSTLCRLLATHTSTTWHRYKQNIQDCLYLPGCKNV